MATPIYPVKSSQLAYIGYEKEEKHLFITFKNGSVYRYEDVNESTFLGLKFAESVGKYFAEHIRDNYEFSKIK
jgi:hypothetical protein